MRRNVLFTALLVMLTILVKAQPVTITPPSANIQPGESVTLTASGATYYQWSPATGLSTTVGPVTVASPTVTTTYTCDGFAPGAESVVNSDFSQGNVGFTSAYEYNSNLWNEGTYYVDSDASLHHESFVGYGHNGGNFMMVNGSTSPGTNVWTEQISVNPNTYYAFSTWVCTLAGTSSQVAWLQFSINGVQIGEVFSAPSSTMIWEQFYELWYSGSSTTATITILNQNTVGSGNDFGLDDISFRELVVIGSPTCTVYVGSMSATATADDTELCEGESTTLHALPTGGSGNYSYSWTPTNTLNDPTSQNPVATPPVGSTTYTCLVTDNSWGNSQNVSVSVVVHPNETTHEYDTICQGDTIDFHGQMASLPDTYPYQTQTQYGCEKTMYLHLENWPAYDETTIDTAICYGGSYTFHAQNYNETYTTSTNTTFTLETVHGCDSIVRLNLTVYPPNDTLLVERSICVGDTCNFHGTIYDQDGQIAFFDTFDNHGCPKVEKLMLSVGEYQTPPLNVWNPNQYVCYNHGEDPYYYWAIANREYHANAIDSIILEDPTGGCDFKYRLNLSFHEEFYHEDLVSTCNEYYWPVTGETYNESIDTIVTFQYEFGDNLCDSIYVLNLNIGNYEPNPTEIYPLDYANTAPHWVITATEFQINSYDFHVEDLNPYSVWDSVTWNFTEPMQWVLEPFGKKNKSCRVYVLNYVEDTVWLEAHVYNQCTTEGIPQRYWFVCSFYDVEEHAVGVKVYPNPAQDVVIIESDAIEQVRVVDMLGQVVESQRYNHDGSVTLNLGHLSPSIYLLEVKTEAGIVKRRIVLKN